MGKTAVIFPGQGAQYVGMAKDFYDNFEDSKKVFDEADDVLDIELKKICFEENDDITMKYGVRNIPTIVFLKGGELVDKQVGACPKDALKAKIEKLL